MLNLSKITDYILIYLMIAFSGIPFFYKAHIAMMIAFLAIPALVFAIRKRKIDRYFVIYVVVLICIQLGQTLKFYDLPIATYIGMHVRVMFAYLTIKAVGRKTVDYYIDIMVFSVLASLVFYLSSYIGPVERFMEGTIAPLFENPLIKESNYKVWPNIILYTFNSQGEGLVLLKRNSGPFWEPGAFSGFLIVALLFSIIKTGKLHTRKNRILMLGVITTFSTSGLVVVVGLIIFYLLINKNSTLRYIMIPLVVVTGLIAFFSLNFLGNKIIQKMSYSSATYNTRFKSAEIDFYDFLKHPLIGMGRSEDTRFQGEKEARTIHRNNGVTNHLVMYGGIAFILYFYLMYLGFRRMCIAYEVDKRMAFFAIVTIFLIGFSQVYFIKVFFIALTLFPVLYNDDTNSIENHVSTN
ncbi:O-antigen ligase family protein [Labilibacter marinus]|uniref:O-antigen ligase family protein n=1 Tax=Labilibacter marinus TaxID=1477105 RepID=UPI00094FDAAE|nr:O-antigen ligase family protein [Labilibacter marinus]